jgi:uncharacterized protein YfdQ (DUF2303 family)
MPSEIVKTVPADADVNFARTIADESRRPILDAIGGRPVAFLPREYTLQDLQAMLPAPTRKSGSVTLSDADSFVAYVLKHRVDDGTGVGTGIYCRADFAKGDVRLVAVFNDHTAGSAGWRDHQAIYDVPKSEEWKRWTGRNGQAFTQAEFAAFIEENQRDIASADGLPTGGDMLAMALSLEINQDARFKSSVRLQSGGVEMTLVDQEDDATLKRMQVFERFALGIAPFFNGEPYQLVARLRYRAQEGRLRFWYELVRPDLVVQHAAQTMVAKVSAETAVPVLMGHLNP